MTTTVQNIRRIDPEIWLADENNVYVGRWNRTGKYTWQNSAFGNPYKFIQLDREDERRYKLFLYMKHLATELPNNPTLLALFKTLPGKNLGCWCCDWDGDERGLSSPVPFCHAAWLASTLNHLEYQQFVIISETGGVHVCQEQSQVDSLLAHATNEQTVIKRVWLE